jgi:hypothetical protein
MNVAGKERQPHQTNQMDMILERYIQIHQNELPNTVLSKVTERIPLDSSLSRQFALYSHLTVTSH